jgi:NDP-sugar pyrophosphorylase family protein
VKAVVLVGGEGTRLRPLTYTTPKQLLPVAEVPMVERVLAWLARHGVDEAVLSVGYRPDAFMGAYPQGATAGVRLAYAVEPEPLDTAGAIRFAAEEAKITGTFVVVNGDVLTDLDLTSLCAFHRDHRATATISLVAVDDPSRFGVVPTDDDGRVTAFVEKPPAGLAPTNCINAGTYVLEPEVLDRIPSGRRVSVERETFPALVAEGRLYARRSDEYWLDTGTPEAYLRANADLVAGRRGLPPAPGAEEASDGVWVIGSAQLSGELRPASLVGSGARLEPGSFVAGSVVGSGVRVSRHARVEGSVLLPGAVVGEGSVVRRSIVGLGAVVGRGCTVEAETIVGDGAAVADGSALAGGRVSPADAPAQSPADASAQAPAP